jgi:uncharacterized protein YjbI with pentapeptide repeats
MMANEEHLGILKKGVDVWNEHRKRDRRIQSRTFRVDPGAPDFGKRYLFTPDLRGASLRGFDLRGANFHRADLRDADISDAMLVRVDLRQANLRRAILRETNLRSANLCEAHLNEANLISADFNGSQLAQTDFSKSIIGWTTFANLDLSTSKGLESVKHVAPSSLGVETIYKSKTNLPEVFLRGCGIPKPIIDAARSLGGTSFSSCFISHSAKDKRFCERLYADLQAKGVRVWYFPEDAKWGETVWGEIDRSIKVYDKLIVVLSENSLQSGPVSREIERALNREDKEGKGILFPIRIDDYVFDKWEHERKADVLRKVVGDFSGWDKDAAKYEKAFDKLLKGLQAESKK